MANTETIELLGYGFKPEKTADKFSFATGEILFTGEKTRVATFKLNSWAMAPDVLNLKTSAEQKKSNMKHKVSIAPGAGGKVVIFNSTDLDEFIGKEHLLNVSSTTHSIKLSVPCVTSIYKSNDLPIDSELKDTENWIFKLNAGTANIGGRTINVFTISKLKKKAEVKPKVKAERTEDQRVMVTRIKKWMDEQKAEGKKTSIAKYWEDFYLRNPNVKSWIDAESLEGKTPTIKKFEAAYPKTEIQW